MTSIVGERDLSLENLEIRPGGMLVQKRNSVPNQSSSSIPNIRVKVKYGSSYHDICISSQASFGELKKKLAGPTGVHPQDQKLIYKNKERDSKTYLDVAKVKDKSKMVLVEDIFSRERRCLEMLKIANLEKASKSLAEINLKIDKLGEQVVALESRASKDDKVKKMDVDNLTEMLMSKLIELDGIVADGDLELQRRVEVRRVQTYIEALDMLKLQSYKCSSMRSKSETNLQRRIPSHSDSLVVTNKWETFD